MIINYDEKIKDENEENINNNIEENGTFKEENNSYNKNINKNELHESVNIMELNNDNEYEQNK